MSVKISEKKEKCLKGSSQDVCILLSFVIIPISEIDTSDSNRTLQTVPRIESTTATDDDDDNAIAQQPNASEILQTLQHHTQRPTISDNHTFTPAFGEFKNCKCS